MAWQVAAVEAAKAASEFIEPTHFLIGICSVEKVLSGDSSRKVGLTAEQIESLRAEVGVLDAELARRGKSAKQMRRSLREALGKGDYSGPERREVSRSPALKAAFAGARDKAKAEGADKAALVHFFVVLSEDGVPASETPFLDKHGRDLTALAAKGKLQACIGRRDELLQLVRTLSRATKNNPLLIGEAGVGKTAIVEGLAWRIAQGKSLAGMRLVQVQMSELVAGTKYRGDFEQRLTEIVAEAGRVPGLILFIDEIHTMVGAGDSSGNMDAANILKPALARGEVRCIGATTEAEYRRFIAKDPALERRFQVVTVPEPTVEEAEAILQAGYVARFEERHSVEIGAGAVRAAVQLGARYLPERRLPDKAIDLLDEACALVAVPVLSAMPGERTDGGGLVTGETVAEVLARWTGIPVGTMDDDDRARLRGMAAELKRRVIGQDEACEKVAEVVQRARAGLKAAGRPVGVLLFAGPTGVGKTELAKATASFLFGSDRAMVRLDMSEYMEKHTVSRLVGSPPGYVGHEEEGQLTGALRRTPFCVVVLDEVEKAHPDVLNLFLQVFDDGRLTDAKGQTADATNALFLLTSNAGAARMAVGFQREEVAAATMEVMRAFRPEFTNRLDAVVMFRALGPESTVRIAGLMLADLGKRLRGQDVGLVASGAAAAWLGAKGYDAAYGARALRRAVEVHVENPVAGLLLRGEVEPGGVVVVDVRDGELEVRVRDSEEN